MHPESKRKPSRFHHFDIEKKVLNKIGKAFEKVEIQVR